MTDRTKNLIAPLGIILLCTLSACTTPKFIQRVTTSDSTTNDAVTFQVTPRELLVARLMNPPSEDGIPPITVGKLIEFADRYLSCDCSGTRFVRSWQRTGNGYRLSTNSEQIRPLDFACRNEAELTTCYLEEIDRGAHIKPLSERFVPGADFIKFMYQNGLRCEREEPCPVAATPTSN